MLTDGEIDRPLIDIFHEATFSNPIGMQWVTDLYGFRTALRKAHCFTIDRETSALIADFSLAICEDLDSVRQLAIPPFPTTWFEIDNVARLDRLVALGFKLSAMAANNPCTKVGHKKRWHEVRGHLRRIKTADGGARLVKVNTHNRGDERLGKIIKTYRVEK